MCRYFWGMADIPDTFLGGGGGGGGGGREAGMVDIPYIFWG